MGPETSSQQCPPERCDAWCAAEWGGIELTSATYSRHVFGRHMHEGFAIAVVDQGTGTFVSRGATHIAPVGSITVLHPEEPHTGGAAREPGYLCYRTFLIGRSALADHLASDPSRTGTPTFSASVIDDAGMAARLRWLHDVLRNARDPLFRTSALTDTLGALFAHHSRWVAGGCVPTVSREAQDIRIVSRVREFLDASYRQRVTLRQIADVFQLSETGVLRAFRAVLGLPPYAYLLVRRIEAAKRQLAAGEPVSRVAVECGFVDQSHLTRHFTRIVGLPPARYAQAAHAPLPAYTRAVRRVRAR